MYYNNDNSEQGLGKLRIKYGGSVALLLVNIYVFVAVLTFVLDFFLMLFPNRNELIDSSTDIGYLILMLFNEFVSYVPFLILFSLIFRSDLREKREIPTFADDGYRRFPGETILLFLAGSCFANCGSIITNYISTLFNSLLGVPEVETAFSSLMPSNIFRYATFEFCTVIIAPICEEIIYRHIVLKPLRKYSDNTAAVMSALMFALSHFNFSQFLYTFFFGYFLAIIAIRSDSVIPAIICHIINNAIAGIQTYMPETFGSETLDSIFSGIAGWLSEASVIMFFVSFLAAAVAVGVRLLRLRNNCGIPVKRQFAIIFSDPLLIISILLCLGATFWNLYT